MISKNVINYQINSPRKIIIRSLIIGLLVGVVDALMDYLFVYEDISIINAFLSPPWHDVVIRLLFILSFWGFGLLMARQLKERQRAAYLLRRNNQLLLALKEVNRLTARSTHTESLIDDACHILVKTRGYSNVWLALGDEGANISQWAKAGIKENCTPFDELMQSGQWPNCAKRALKAKDFTITENPSQECGDCPLRENYRMAGAFTMPLQSHDNVYGVIGVAVDTAMLYDEQEQVLFKQLAGDLAYAVRNLENEKRRAYVQRQLQENEERLQMAIDGADLGLYDWNVKTGDTVFNKQWGMMLGYTPEELPPHIETWEQKVHPDDYHVAQEALHAHMAGKTAFYEAEHRMKTKAGGWKWILDRGKVMERDAQGYAVRVTGTHLDIHSRKLAEEEVLKSRENLRITLESIGDGVISTDLNGNIAQMNRVAAQLTGWHADEARGKKLEDVFYIKQALTGKKLANPVQRVLSEGITVGLANHTVLVSRDNASYQIADSAAPVRDKSGGITGVVLVFRDVTEEYRMREALEQSEKQLRKAQALAKLGSWEFYLKTGKVVASEETRRLYGLSANEPLTIKQVQQIPLPEYRGMLDDAMEKLIRGEGAYDVEFKIKQLNTGSIRDIHSYASYDPEKQVVTGSMQDVTVRKQAEELTLFQSRLLNAVGQAVIATDMDGAITYWNEAAETLYGWAASEVMGQNIIEITPSHISQKQGQEIMEYVYAGQSWSGEFMVENRKGHAFHAIITNTPYYNEQGQMAGIIGISTDITRRKAAEKKLSDSERKMQRLLSNLPGLAYRALNVPNYTMKYISDGVYRITGYAPEQFIDDRELAFAAIIYKDDKNRVWETVQHAVKNNQHFEVEYRIITKNKHVRWVWERGLAIYNDDGQPWRLEGFISDVTSRKLAEKELKKSEEKYRHLFNSIRDAIVVTDNERQIIDCNQAFVNLFGYSADEITGYDTSFIYEDTKEFRDMGRNIHRNFGRTMLKIYNFKTRSGRIFPGEVGVYFLQDEEGKVEGLIGLVRDVTERVKAEQQLKQKNEELQAAEEELRVSLDDLKSMNKQLEEQSRQYEEAKEHAEESDRLKSAFLANMSHEIRTPLNGILGFTGILKKDHITAAKRLQYAKIIERSGKRMLDTINDLIDISRIETGQAKIYATDTAVDKLLRELQQFFSTEAERRGLALTLEEHYADADPVVYTDEEKLYSIMANLLKNALKYTEEGSVVFGCSFKPAVAEFYVKDTGIGITQERQKAIFERFVQADLKYASTKDGTGLGLAITRAYVHMLGGTIDLQSETGKGSVFYFEIPRNIKEQER